MSTEGPPPVTCAECCDRGQERAPVRVRDQWHHPACSVVAGYWSRADYGGFRPKTWEGP